ncbi:hypothetical protein KIL84_004656, partial [Mauremys mutica]
RAGLWRAVLGGGITGNPAIAGGQEQQGGGTEYTGSPSKLPLPGPSPSSLRGGGGGATSTGLCSAPSDPYGNFPLLWYFQFEARGRPGRGVRPPQFSYKWHKTLHEASGPKSSGPVTLRLDQVTVKMKVLSFCHSSRASSPLPGFIVFFLICYVHKIESGLGSAPLISVEGHQDGGIRVVCRSTGWYPEPEVLWKDFNGRRLPSLSETTSRGNNNLFEIETAIVVKKYSNQNLSCCIRNTILNQEKESAVYIADPFFPRVNPWMVALKCDP